MTTESCLSSTPNSSTSLGVDTEASRNANLQVSQGSTSKHTPHDLELEKELEQKHLRCLERLAALRQRLEPRYQDWYIAIDPDSGVYMMEPDLMEFYRKINTYFPKTLDLGLYRLNPSRYIGKI